MEAKRTTPTQPLLKGFPYTSAAATDVTRTWQRHGWQPPSRERQDAARERLNPIRRLES